MNERVWNRKIAIIVGIACVLLIGFGAMAGYSRSESTRIKSHNINDRTDACSISIVQTKGWSEEANGYEFGIQYDGNVSNYTDSNMVDWNIEIQMPAGVVVDSLWEGAYTYDETSHVLIISPLDYNKEVFAGENRTFGFVIHSNQFNNILDANFNYHSNVDLFRMPLFYVWCGMVLIFVVAVIVSSIYSKRTARIEVQKNEYFDIINQSFLTFANMIDAKDKDTNGHSLRVALYSRELARKLGFDENEQQRVFYIGLLHDIGKIGTADAVLKKNGRLTSDEYSEMVAHVIIGGEIIKDFSAIDDIEAGVRFHHERWDGKGYAEGLKENEIPLRARIVGIADAFDAMTSDRVYRKAMPTDEARAELIRCAGSQFDPNMVPKMVELIDEKVIPIELSPATLYKELRIRSFGSYV